MGFLSGGRHQQSGQVLPQYTGLQLTTAANTMPIPIVYGLAKIGQNILYYDNFVAIPELSATKRAGKGGVLHGGGGGVTITGWFYEADVILGLCEGPIVNIGQLWQGQSTWKFAADSPNPMGWNLAVNSMGCSLFKGADDQSVWPHIASTAYALEYSGTAYLAAANFYLGESASVGTLNFEVAGRFFGTGANGIDADPAPVIQDFLTHPRYGAGYAGEIGLQTLLGNDGDSSLQTYCKALDLCFSPVVNQQEQAASILTRWMQILNCAAFRSGGELRFVPYGDMDLSGNGVTWKAPIAPIVDLTDDDFIYDEGEDPVTVERVDPTTLATVMRVEALNRAGVNVAAALVVQQINEALAIMQAASSAGRETSGYTLPTPTGQPQYQATPVEARDLSAVLDVGYRVGSTITTHEVCDLNVASIVAQTLLQRQLYIRAHFKFRLGPLHCLLDPMDVVTIGDPRLGLVQKLVRITAIEEDEHGLLEVTAEDLTIGVSTPGPNITMGAVSGNNAGLAADPVDGVLIYEPPFVLTNGVAQIWFGASGGVGGVASKNWGGAYIWVSADGGTTYQKLTTIYAPLAQGVLTATLPDASAWDTGSTLAVDMTMSGATLTSTTDQNAQLGAANLCLVGSELLAFATATLTGVNQYALTRLQRGMFGAAHASHAPGAPFAQLDNVAKLDLPPQYIGVALKVKFQSFNALGGGVQDIGDCVAFDYTPTGAGLAGSSRLVTVSQTLTASGASLATSIAIPANAYLLNVTVTVASAVSGATSFNIDPQFKADGSAGGTAGSFGSCAVAYGSTRSQSMAATLWKTASGIVLTPLGGSFSGGSITVSIQYLTVG